MKPKSAIEIVDPGLLSTVQDRGRRSVGQFGVSPSGAADWLSARAANRLVGNPHAAALIETTLTGLTFKALRELLIAVTGARARLTVGGEQRPLWQSLRVQSGLEVKIGIAEQGLRSYVAVFGGLHVPIILGSASTDITAAFGGLGGRPLARGDLLAIMPIEAELAERSVAIAAALRPSWHQPALLGVLPGSHVKQFSRGDVGLLTRQIYRVSPHSSRQGIRLEGQPLAQAGGFDVLSCGVCAGCIQLTSDGMPIILLAEHHTTGGYAVPLTVVSAHVPEAAQLRPGDHVHFTPMTQPEAALALTAKMRVLTEGLHASDAAG